MLKITAMLIRKRNNELIDDAINDKKGMTCETCEFLDCSSNAGPYHFSTYYDCALCDPSFKGGSTIPEHTCKYYTPNKNYKQYLKRKKKRDRKKFNTVIESWRK